MECYVITFSEEGDHISPSENRKSILDTALLYMYTYISGESKDNFLHTNGRVYYNKIAVVYSDTAWLEMELCSKSRD